LRRAAAIRTISTWKDAEATQLALEALFDIRAAVFDIHDVVVGDEDDGEEEEEDA
jgi:hypothetical protein